ncbi:MAG TPA: fibronectin type III domain-containing protein [Candidatus Blautia faecipullorum]|nr:fibronectin type III domain-containing protein [Candidatus Blautia faecipullorum]
MKKKLYAVIMTLFLALSLIPVSAFTAAETQAASNTYVAAVRLRSIQSDSPTKVRVTWNRVSGVNGYRVYRKTSGSGWKVMKNVSAAATRYTDTSVKPGTRYTYTVRAYKRINGRVYWGGYQRNGWTVTTRRAANTSVATAVLRSAEAKSYTEVSLAWNRVSGANGYRIYRKTSGTGWRVLRNVSSAATRYTDKTAEPGIKYTYTVRAYRRVNGRVIWGGYNRNGVSAVTPRATITYKGKKGEAFDYKGSKYSYRIGFERINNAYLTVWDKNKPFGSSYEEFFAFKVTEGVRNYRVKGMNSGYYYDIYIKPYGAYVKISIKCRNTVYQKYDISNRIFMKIPS